MSTKAYTIYRLDDPSCPDGKMKKIDGPAIRKAIKQGRITENETFDCDEMKLIKRLKDKGVI